MSHLDRTIEAIDSFMINFGTYLGDKWSSDDIYRELRNAPLPASVIQLSLVDAGGRFIASNLAPPGNPFDLSDRDHVRVHLDGLAGDNVFVSKPVKGRVSKVWTIQFSRAVRNEHGRLLGVLVASYEIADLMEFYSRLRTDPNVLVVLVGFDGVIRARAAGAGAGDRVGQDMSNSAAFQLMRESPEGVYQSVSPLDQVERIGYFVSSKRFPLTVLVASDRTFVRRQSEEFMVATGAVSAGLGVALLVLGVMVIRNNRLEQRLRTKEFHAGARQREAQFLRAFGNMPGVSVVHVSGDVASPIGASSSDDASPVARYVRGSQFVSRLAASDASSVNIEHFTQDGEEHEIQYVVAQIGNLENAAAPQGEVPEREMVVFALDRTAARTEENNLYQMSKMAALGELVTGLAHEINQPLGVIRLAAANALSGLKRGLPPEHTEEKLNRIIHQTGRMKAIIDHMRIFGRKSELRREPSSVAAAIEGALQVVGTQIRLDDITLTAPLPTGPDVKVLCRQEQLEQVLINLLLNARDAVRARRQGTPGYRGAIDVTCVSEPGEGNACTVRLVVRDNAGGVPESIIGKVFQPFFTTKAAGQGTGLGLSVSFGIIRDHGGNLSVANDADGAVFTIILPGLMPEGDPLLDAPA
ncbi:ATP-binding protein [Aquabacter cavernae]|uniref:ATP-binding protein n=1 Tax=Aquabacter cavernae TaxID=2496029 RepID=UPI0013E059DB|nr:ATP-binding protein [Aquabacter cavernae]